MNSKIFIYLSSLTGNTEKLALGVCEELKKQGIFIEIKNSKHEVPETESNNFMILFFWCRKSGLDYTSKEFLKLCNGKNIVAVGTMGGYPDSEYGEKVIKNVYEEISKQNNCNGVFFSQGKINADSTERRRKFPIDHPHYLDEFGLKRHIESRKHPDKQDIIKASEFIMQRIRLIKGFDT